MSNVIRFVDGSNEIEIPLNELDMARLLQVIELHKKHTGYDFQLDDVFCWFLRHNSHIDLQSKNLHITVGKGHSEHTNRDFKTTMAFVASLFADFTGSNETVILESTDESDGFKSVSKMNIYLSRYRFSLDGGKTLFDPREWNFKEFEIVSGSRFYFD